MQPFECTPPFPSHRWVPLRVFCGVWWRLLTFPYRTLWRLLGIPDAHKIPFWTFLYWLITSTASCAVNILPLLVNVINSYWAIVSNIFQITVNGNTDCDKSNKMISVREKNTRTSTNIINANEKTLLFLLYYLFFFVIIFYTGFCRTMHQMS